MPFGLIAGLLAGGGSLLGGLFGANASENAAQTQANAANEASRLQMREFEQIRRSLLPYMRSGGLANKDLESLLGIGPGGFNYNTSPLTRDPMKQLGGPPHFTLKQFHESPGYQFSLQQGENAIQNAATPGGAYSGATLKALQSYGTGLANQEYQQDYQNYINNYWNRYNAITGRQNQTFNMLRAMAGSGQNAAAQSGAFGTTAATNVGQNIIGAGNALASGQIGAANSLLGGFNGFMGNLLSPSSLGQNSMLAALLSGGGASGGFSPFSGNQDFSSVDF